MLPMQCCLTRMVFFVDDFVKTVTKTIVCVCWQALSFTKTRSTYSKYYRSENVSVSTQWIYVII